MKTQNIDFSATNNHYANIETTSAKLESMKKLTAGQEYNIELFNRTGKCVVPSESVEDYRPHIDFKTEPVTHKQFLDYTKLIKH